MIRVVATAAAALALGAPVAFTQPTSIEALPNSKLLVVENNPGRILRVDPANGRVTVLAKGLHAPYSIVRAPSGAVYYSQGPTLRRLGGGVVARNAAGVGPVAVARDGTLYYTTANAVYAVGRGRIAANMTVDSPHGLAAARDGTLLVSDTGGNRVLRVGADGDAAVFAAVTSPRGIDVGANGDVFVIDPVARRVERFAPDGASLGAFGPRLPGDPYDVQAGARGSLYVLEAGQVGHIRVIDAHGRLTSLRRR
jgi:sugar lactone lactonase YvrE